jgi:choline-sulfatase
MKVVGIGIIFCLTAVAGYAAGTSRKKTAPPNVFLVTIDTLRADHVHCYGYDSIQTPALDRLGKDGIRFAEAFTPSPLTNISHATILTGLLPSSHGVTDFAVPLAETHLTWADLLKKNGYRTAAFIGAVVLDSNTLAPGLDRGFDFYDNFPDQPPTRSRWNRVERRGHVVVQRAENWLSSNRSTPAFVWIHLYDPHDPYEPPPPYSHIYKDNLYDGEIAYADSALLDFVEYLKRRHWYESSLIIVVGDHGEGLGEHHEDTHGIFLYDSTTHVPLILKLPGDANSGTVVQSQVRTTDILPTVIDLLHVPTPPRLDGESLRPDFESPNSVDRTAVGQTDYPLHFDWAPLRSVRAEGFKFIEAPRPELYNLGADPGELKNVYQPQDATAQKLRAMFGNRIRVSSSPAVATGLSGHRSADQLKALGYAGSARADESSTLLESSLLRDPKDVIEQQNLLHRAMLALEDNRRGEARQSLEKVLELNPKSSIALRQLGELELQADEYVTAANHLRSAREMHPEDATIAFNEGQALERSGDLSGARDALEASLKLVPEQFSARLLLGNVYIKLKKSQAAEDQFEAALLLQPKSVEAQLGDAEAQIGEGSFAGAVQQLEQVLKAHPNNAKAFRLIAQAYSGMGREEEADRTRHRAKLLEYGRHVQNEGPSDASSSDLSRRRKPALP